MGRRIQVTPAATFTAEDSHDWAHCRWRLLAEGDSWFSIGSLNLFESANLLQAMEFSAYVAAVECAFPGDTLARMVTLTADPRFQQLLGGVLAWRWDAIVLSAGGNDLIDAAGLPPDNERRHRLLLKADEWGDAALGPARYLCAEGWQTFSDYLRANLDVMIALRDRGAARGRPLCMHTYAYPTPRPAGAGAGVGPWLMPALARYAIPEADWPAVARGLLDQLAELLLACAADGARYPALHVFDSRALGIVPAAPGETGRSGDWVNEIHLTMDGCRKLALPWSAAIEAAMLANP